MYSYRRYLQYEYISKTPLAPIHPSPISHPSTTHLHTSYHHTPFHTHNHTTTSPLLTPPHASKCHSSAPALPPSHRAQPPSSAQPNPLHAPSPPLPSIAPATQNTTIHPPAGSLVSSPARNTKRRDGRRFGIGDFLGRWGWVLLGGLLNLILREYFISIICFWIERIEWQGWMRDWDWGMRGKVKRYGDRRGRVWG